MLVSGVELTLAPGVNTYPEELTPTVKSLESFTNAGVRLTQVLDVKFTLGVTVKVNPSL